MGIACLFVVLPLYLIYLYLLLRLLCLTAVDNNNYRRPRGQVLKTTNVIAPHLRSKNMIDDKKIYYRSHAIVQR